MAVNNDTATTGPLYGNGLNKSFPFDFIAASGGEVAVYVDGLQLASSAFSVALQDDGTGTVTMVAAPANGAEIYLSSDPSFQETVQFERYGPYFPDQINAPLDRAAIRSIYLRGIAQRALLAPVGELGISLPGVEARANKMLAFDSAGNALPTAIPTLPAPNPAYAGLYLAYDASGNPIASSGTGTDAGLRTDLAATAGAALVKASDGTTVQANLDARAYIIATKAEAASVTVPSDFSVVQLLGGVAAGDGATGTQWLRRGSEPDHPGYFQDAGGAYFEIVGPELPVEAFGAAGDCPDCSGYDPVTQQAAIKAAIAGATNDIQAFQDAFKTAKAYNGATVTFGHGKIYRLGFSPTGCHMLVIGDNTTLKQVGGGWLEFDPAGITGYRPADPTGGFPTHRGWYDSGIVAGDPYTGLAPSLPVMAGANNIVPASANATDADFIHNVHFRDVVGRTHTRVYWHDIPDQTTPVIKRFHMYGIVMRFVLGGSVIGCDMQINGGDGFLLGGNNLTVDHNTGRYCGYGSVKGASKNSFSLIGIQVVGQPALSCRSVYFTNNTSYYARDEGVAKCGIKSCFITNFSSYGDQDRAVEGISGYQTTLTSADIGETLDADCTIDGIFHDGEYPFGTATTTAGSTTIQLSDAYPVCLDTTTTGYFARYIFIPGAGPSGSNGPFLVTAVDYAANTITVDTAPTNSVSNVLASLRSRSSVTVYDVNEIRTTIKNVRARNIYGTIHIVASFSTTKGRHRIEDIELENVNVPSPFAAIYAAGSRATIKNVDVFNSSGAFSAIQTLSNACSIKDFRVSGFQYAVDARGMPGTFSTILELENGYCAGSTGSFLNLAYALNAGLINISNCKGIGLNSAGASDQGFLRLGNNALAANNINMHGCFGRFAGKTSAPVVIGSGIALANYSMGQADYRNNDFMDPQHLSNTSLLRLQVAGRSCYTDYIDVNNLLPGRRTINVASVPPTSGRYYTGETLKVEYPAAGGVGESRVADGGNYSTLYAADFATAVTVTAAATASPTIVVSDATNIWPNDKIMLSGTQRRLVLWVDYPTNTLTLTTNATVASGDTVANATPVLKTSSTLAA